jgi:hypothetical protein
MPQTRYMTYLQPNTGLLYVHDLHDSPDTRGRIRLADPYGDMPDLHLTPKALAAAVQADLFRHAWSADNNGRYTDLLQR